MGAIMCRAIRKCKKVKRSVDKLYLSVNGCNKVVCGDPWGSMGICVGQRGSAGFAGIRIQKIYILSNPFLNYSLSTLFTQVYTLLHQFTLSYNLYTLCNSCLHLITTYLLFNTPSLHFITPVYT